MFILAVGLILALGGEAPSPNQAAQRGDLRTWDQAYDDGLNAFNKRDWPGAIASLEAARQKDSNPSRNKSATGNRVVDYVPDYYLAIAYFNLKRYRESDDAFKRLEASKVVMSAVKDNDKLVNIQNDAPKAAFEVLTADANTLIGARRFSEAQATIDQASQLRGADQSRVKDLMGRLTAANVQQSNASSNPPAAYPPAGAANPPAGANNPPASTNPPPATTPVRVAEPPLESEAEGVRLFFSGQYEQARDFFLKRIYGEANGLRDQLYVGASEAALVLIGRADPSTLQEARMFYGYAMSKRAAFDKELKLISPKILKLLQAK